MDRRSTERFSSRARSYAKYRFRTYPRRIVDAVLEGLGDPRKLWVADVGAGTGISSQLLAERGAHVIAIEPNAAMRAAAIPNPNVEWREGLAEATGLEDGSVDIALAFQAFHWFDPHAAFTEFARIARRRIANVQSERDESDPACAAFGALVRAYSIDDTDSMRIRALESFMVLAGERLRTRIVHFTRRMSLEELVGYCDSFSYLPCDGPEGEALHRELEALFTTYSVDGWIEIAMRMYVLFVDL